MWMTSIEPPFARLIESFISIVPEDTDAATVRLACLVNHTLLTDSRADRCKQMVQLGELNAVGFLHIAHARAKWLYDARSETLRFEPALSCTIPAQMQVLVGTDHGRIVTPLPRSDRLGFAALVRKEIPRPPSSCDSVRIIRRD
jgi:hypothetical protein